MKIKLRELKDGRHMVRIDQTAKVHELPGCGPVRGELTVEKNREIVLVTGSLEFTADQSCSRCLKIFPRTFRQEIDLCYRPSAAPRHGKDHEDELSADDLITIVYKKNEIDLWPEIREAALLALPLKPLCREQCKGICPSCGRDLNAKECECREDRTDPRWEKLKKLTGG
ncbi:MAG: DUF177 domain-containing protein [Candidatus Edwardsbacteria bacterium]|nr:DUF177 domain-containing protein [Candidatus Edwardsbacteria bacterium]